MRWTVLLAGFLGAVGVALGAFAAHGLEKNLTGQGLEPDVIVQRLEQCEVAVRYHMTHTLVLLSLGLWGGAKMKFRRMATCILFLAGILLFSGGLYSMVFWGQMGHWAIVPSGGLCFILGWIGIISMAWMPQAD